LEEAAKVVKDVGMVAPREVEKLARLFTLRLGRTKLSLRYRARGVSLDFSFLVPAAQTMTSEMIPSMYLETGTYFTCLLTDCCLPEQAIDDTKTTWNKND
jgi:hypothetical protein